MNRPAELVSPRFLPAVRAETIAKPAGILDSYHAGDVTLAVDRARASTAGIWTRRQETHEASFEDHRSSPALAHDYSRAVHRERGARGPAEIDERALAKCKCASRRERRSASA